MLNGAAKNLKKECAKHEAAVRRHGIDLCVLGIAPNGHVGFNEPGSSPGSVTRVVRLRPETVKKNAGYFPGVDVPKKGVTMGLGTIRDNSRRILLLASGKHKAGAIRKMIFTKDVSRCPAAILKTYRFIGH